MGARVFTTRIHQGVPTMPENKSAVPRADSGSPGRPRPGHPQAAAGIVLPVPAVTAQTGRQGPVRRDLLSLDRGRGSRPARSMTWSRPWATSPVPPDPPSQGSARTSARESRSFCPGHWTTPGSPTCSWTPPTSTYAWATGWSARPQWSPPGFQPKDVARSWAWLSATPRPPTFGRPSCGPCASGD